MKMKILSLAKEAQKKWIPNFGASIISGNLWIFIPEHNRNDCFIYSRRGKRRTIARIDLSGKDWCHFENKIFKNLKEMEDSK